MKIYSKITVLILVTCLSLSFIACEQERLEDALEIADGAGTLTNYKAYTLDSISGQGTGIYGRAVFWEGLSGNTLLQISLYNISEGVAYPSAIYSGDVTSSGSMAMELYTIENTGEGYDFGEFSTSKYYVIADSDFYDNLDTYDANIKILMSSSDDTVISSGNIGVNAEPVETN